MKMRAVMVQQGVSKELKKKDKIPKSMSENEKDEMDKKALTSIKLYLLNEVLLEVAYEKTAASL